MEGTVNGKSCLRLQNFLLLGALVVSPVAAQRLVVLTDTGVERDGLPVLTRHPEADQIAEQLDTGLIRRVSRLYGWVEDYRTRAGGPPAEPIYLFLSSNQGGFPRYGFFLDDEKKPDVAFVDLNQSSALTGRFGSVDQILPHELGHVFIRHLIGDLQGGGSNQVHAIGLQTDRPTAFNEGFAEHFQLLALEDPGAAPDTSRLLEDHDQEARAYRNLQGYRDELVARWTLATPYQMRFLLWYSRTEDVLRYYGVKENAFARSVPVPQRLLQSRDPFKAYLLRAVTLGPPEAPLDPPGVLLSTEGVISHFFYRLVTDPELGRRRQNGAPYETFQVEASELDDLENALLKVFYTFLEEKPGDVAQVVRSYRKLFPEDAPDVDQLVREVFSVQELPDDPEIWLANPDFRTGTTLFDQYRGLPRTHTFDLNAASRVDLMGVPGMSPSLAERILARRPFARLSDLKAVPGISGELLETFLAMDQEMQDLRGHREDESGLSLQSILAPFWKRAVLVLGISTLLGALLYRLVRKNAWWRVTINALGLSLCFLTLTWVVADMAGWRALAATAVFWLPAAIWQWLEQRQPMEALRVCIAWWLALLPAWIMTTPFF